MGGSTESLIFRCVTAVSYTHLTNLGKINTVAMTGLFLLTLVLCKVIFVGGNTVLSQPDDSLSFGAAVELAVAMPLSWLPLISDYTREAEKPVAATAVSAVVYGLVSCWMYVIGMGAVSYTHLFCMKEMLSVHRMYMRHFIQQIWIWICQGKLLEKRKL